MKAKVEKCERCVKAKAVVMLNNRWLCLACFDKVLKSLADVVRELGK